MSLTEVEDFWHLRGGVKIFEKQNDVFYGWSLCNIYCLLLKMIQFFITLVSSKWGSSANSLCRIYPTPMPFYSCHLTEINRTSIVSVCKWGWHNCASLQTPTKVGRLQSRELSQLHLPFFLSLQSILLTAATGSSLRNPWVYPFQISQWISLKCDDLHIPVKGNAG